MDNKVDVKKSIQIEWHKEPQLLKDLFTLRNKGYSYAEVAQELNIRYNMNVDREMAKSAYHRHKDKESEIMRSIVNTTDTFEAQFRVTKEMLGRMFNLPDGVTITHVDYDHSRGIAAFHVLDKTGHYLPQREESAHSIEIAMNVDFFRKDPETLN